MENKLSIAMFSDSFYPIMGGRETVINHLMTELNKQINCFLLTTTFNGTKTFIPDSDLPYNVIRCKGLRVTKNEYLSIVTRKTKRLIEDKIKNGEIQLIHTQTKYALAKYALKLGKKYNIPVITTCHTYYERIYKKQLKFPPLYKLFIHHSKKMINKMDLVLTVSNYMKDRLMEMGVNKPITVIPNGNDLLKYKNISFNKNELKHKYGLDGYDNIFIFVGRLNPVKNIELLFESLSQLKNKSISFKMLMVGNGELAKYKELANKLDLNENIAFTGPISDREEISKLYSISDLNLYPSITETFGLTIREAGVMGTPSVTIEKMATSEDIEHNENGFICSNSVESLTKAILNAISDKVRLEKISKNVINTFTTSWSDIANTHIEIYNNLINKKH